MSDQVKAGSQLKVGIIGCGGIAPAYMKGCRQFPILDVVACADLDHERAQTFSQEHAIEALAVDDLLARDDIEIVVNLTVPKAHAEVSLAIIASGKHVYSEKPLAITRDEGQRILAASQEKGVRVGCAPDTFLGGGLQTCRQIIDAGWIGEPIGAAAFFMGHGPESWHQNPFFFYQTGAGPLFDLGPYYLTALVHLLGPVQRLTGSARISFPERIATSEKWHGTRIPVEVPTHISGALEFASGPIGTVIFSFDVWAQQLPRIEIYGSEGTLSVPDPNTFRGPVRVWHLQDTEWHHQPGGGWHDGTWQHSGWREVPLTHSPQVARGIGVADLATALRSGRPHRASGELAFHVLNIMLGLYQAADTGQHVTLSAPCQQPAPLPRGLLAGELDR